MCCFPVQGQPIVIYIPFQQSQQQQLQQQLQQQQLQQQQQQQKEFNIVSLCRYGQETVTNAR